MVYFHKGQKDKALNDINEKWHRKLSRKFRNYNANYTRHKNISNILPSLSSDILNLCFKYVENEFANNIRFR